MGVYSYLKNPLDSGKVSEVRLRHGAQVVCGYVNTVIWFMVHGFRAPGWFSALLRFTKTPRNLWRRTTSLVAGDVQEEVHMEPANSSSSLVHRFHVKILLDVGCQYGCLMFPHQVTGPSPNIERLLSGLVRNIFGVVNSCDGFVDGVTVFIICCVHQLLCAAEVLCRDSYACGTAECSFGFLNFQ